MREEERQRQAEEARQRYEQLDEEDRQAKQIERAAVLAGLVSRSRSRWWGVIRATSRSLYYAHLDRNHLRTRLRPS